jgi:hypothetical protein
MLLQIEGSDSEYTTIHIPYEPLVHAFHWPVMKENGSLDHA